MLTYNHFPAKSRIAENDAPEIKVFLLLFRKTKEESWSFLEKRTKRLLLSGAGSKIPDLAGKVIVCQKVDQQEGKVSSYNFFSAEKEQKTFILWPWPDYIRAMAGKQITRRA